MPLIGLYTEDEDTGEPLLWSWDMVPSELLPPEIVNEFVDESRNVPLDKVLHVSDLAGCPYRVVKQRLLPYYLPLSTIYRMSRGRAWDSLVQKKGIWNYRYQEEFVEEYDGRTICGTPDVIRPNSGVIEDFKSPDYHRKEILPGYDFQLNAYRWLARHKYPNIDKLYLSVCANSSYKRIEVGVWDKEVFEENLTTKIYNVTSLYSHGVVAKCQDRWCPYCLSKGIFDDAN